VSKWYVHAFSEPFAKQNFRSSCIILKQNGTRRWVQMFGSVRHTSASLKQAKEVAKSRALSAQFQDSCAASSGLPMGASGQLPYELHERSAMVWLSHTLAYMHLLCSLSKLCWRPCSCFFNTSLKHSISGNGSTRVQIRAQLSSKSLAPSVDLWRYHPMNLLGALEKVGSFNAAMYMPYKCHE
jgi:hypothetical protein